MTAPIHKGETQLIEQAARPNAPKLSRAMAVRIRALVADGVTQRSIARALGVSKNAIFDVVHRITWASDEDPPDPFGGVSADQLRADYESGMTQYEIAAKYATTQKRVWKAMRRFDIEARPAKLRRRTAHV